MLSRRGRLIGLLAGAAALVLTPVMAGAAPITQAQLYKPYGYFRFCAEAQLDAANIDAGVMASKGITISGTIYESQTDFKDSKSAVDVPGKRILTVQWTQYFDAAKTKPRTIRCKMRTGESLTEGIWQETTPNNSPGFEVQPYYGFGSLANGVSTQPVDKSCQVVNQRTIDSVWQQLLDDGVTPAYPKPTTVLDTQASTGDGWLGDQAPLVLTGGLLTVSSRALLAPTYGVGEFRFRGANYCTFVAPEYLRDVLRGTATVA